LLRPGAPAERLVHPGEQGRFGEGLLHDVQVGRLDAVEVQHLLRVARDEHGGQARTDGAHLVDDLVAEHPRHDHVGDQQVDTLARVGGPRDGADTVGRGTDPVAVAGQDPAGHGAQAGLVLDEQDRLAVPARVRRRPGYRRS
jgi:hypothetical protein